MTFKKLTYASVTTCFLSFLTLLCCICLSPIDAKTKEWFVACFFSFIVAFISARILRQNQDNVSEEDKTTIGESKFEVAMITMILWFPVFLAIYAIVGIMIMHLSMEKVGWVLVVLAGNTGFQVAKLPLFSQKS